MTLDMKLDEREELGRHKGKIEGIMESLNKMVKNGVPEETAFKLLELTEDEVAEYRKREQS